MVTQSDPVKAARGLLCLHPLQYEPTATSGESYYVTSNWLNSYRRSQWGGVIPNADYRQFTLATLKHLTQRGMTVLLLRGREHNVLTGFIAFEVADNGRPVVHYMYLGRDYRGRGLSKLLLEGIGYDYGQEISFLYTFRTQASRKYRNAVHAPGIARRTDLEPVHGPKRRTGDSKARTVEPDLLQERNDDQGSAVSEVVPSRPNPEQPSGMVTRPESDSDRGRNADPPVVLGR